MKTNVISKRKFSCRNKRISFRHELSEQYVSLKDGETKHTSYTTCRGAIRNLVFWREGKRVFCREEDGSVHAFTGVIPKPKCRVSRFPNGSWAFGGYVHHKNQWVKTKV